MAGYSLKMHREDFNGGKNVLASENGAQFVHGGATLDASVIGAVTLEAGTAIMRNTTSGLYEVYADATGAVPAGYDGFSILNVDVTLNGTDDVVIGEVIVRGTVYEGKTVGVTDAFKDANPLIRYV
jgi:hypothetical protein